MNPEVVVFGEVLWDFFDVGDDRYLRTLGGSSANIATGLARLGVPTRLVGAVGNDVFGQALEAHLVKDGVDVRNLEILEARTGVTFVTRDAAGEPAFLNYRTGAADALFPASRIRRSPTSTRWVVIGTSGVLAGESADATHDLLETAARAKLPVAVDLNARPALFPTQRHARQAASVLLPRASLVKASEKDLRSLGKDNDAALDWAADHLRPDSCLIITRGARDAAVLGPFGALKAPARKARCVDATGAGDAFFSGVLAALLAAEAAPGSAAWSNPDVWGKALELGHMMGSRAVGEVGATTGLRDLDRVHGALAEIRTKRPPVS